MPGSNSTLRSGAPPPFLLSKPLTKPVPAVLRGQLHHVVGNVAFTEFRRAVCAWSALACDRAEALEQAQDVPPAAAQPLAGSAEVDELRKDLAMARARAKVERESAEYWQGAASDLAHEVGRLQYLLRQAEG